MSCQAITKQGKPCKNKALPGKKYCGIHIKSHGSSPKPAKAKPAPNKNPEKPKAEGKDASKCYDFKIAELKIMANEKGLKYPNNIKKQKLCDMLGLEGPTTKSKAKNKSPPPKAKTKSPPPKAKTKSPPPKAKEEEKECNQHTLLQLKAMAKERGIKGYTKMKKAELCQTLGLKGEATRKRTSAKPKKPAPKRSSTKSKRRQADWSVPFGMEKDPKIKQISYELRSQLLWSNGRFNHDWKARKAMGYEHFHEKDVLFSLIVNIYRGKGKYNLEKEMLFDSFRRVLYFYSPYYHIYISMKDSIPMYQYSPSKGRHVDVSSTILKVFIVEPSLKNPSGLYVQQNWNKERPKTPPGYKKTSPPKSSYQSTTQTAPSPSKAKDDVALLKQVEDIYKSKRGCTYYINYFEKFWSNISGKKEVIKTKRDLSRFKKKVLLQYHPDKVREDQKEWATKISQYVNMLSTECESYLPA